MPEEPDHADRGQSGFPSLRALRPSEDSFCNVRLLPSLLIWLLVARGKATTEGTRIHAVQRVKCQ